ncbi:hypothetical protein M408DRAFT_164869 [Serendipita vermifera MAFF 305830]|uniref:Uncharacterized protein n=1 Tax=Serendipita vermifera MAFF 305830 TaxID=933852 RepID=A0A0C3B5I9_SERVB|nr:hypothetical protein M408DRAFT_164869 [Serendipita vermifera MAFF 305830]
MDTVYNDRFGPEMTPKEAWKALPHRFHRKGSGKMKTEKRLKKIAEEKKMQAMISGETPLGMTSAFQARQEKMGQSSHGALCRESRSGATTRAGYRKPGFDKPKGGKKEQKDERGRTSADDRCISFRRRRCPHARCSNGTCINNICQYANLSAAARQVCTGRLVCGSSYQWGIVARPRKQDRSQPEEKSGRR